MIKLKNMAVNLLLLFVSFSVCIILAELLLRQFYPSIGSSMLYRIPHQTLGWSLKPNTDYVNYLPEASVRVTYNSKGWRDSEHSLEKKNTNQLRIAVLGDSFMEGYSVANEDVFHRRLLTLLSEKDQPVETLNFGVGGYGTLQQYITNRDYASGYDPDIILLGFYLGNDLVDNSIFLSKKPFNPSKKIKSTRPYLDYTKTDSWSVLQADHEKSLKRYHARKSFWFSDFKHTSALRRAFRKLKQRLGLKKRKLRVDDKTAFRNYGPHFCKEPTEVSEGWKVTQRILERLNSEVSQSNAKLVVFTVPALHEVDSHMVKEINANSKEHNEICLSDAPGYQRLEDLTQQLGIKYINLLPAFRKVSDGNGGYLFRLSDRHWNEKGHELAAKTVFSSLVQENMLVNGN